MLCFCRPNQTGGWTSRLGNTHTCSRARLGSTDTGSIAARSRATVWRPWASVMPLRTGQRPPSNRRANQSLSSCNCCASFASR